VRELLANRLQASSTSVSKYKTFLRVTNSDGRVRGTLQFGGAGRTNRWAGRMVQLHNMSRVPKYLKSQYDFAIETIRNGCVDLVYANVMEVIGSTVRGALVATPGHKLCRADLSNIEGRVLAWLAGESWKVKAFAEGEDLYVQGYSRSFRVPVAEVEADEEAGGTMRLIGKVQELACGFGGAVGAFGSMAQLYGVNLTEDRILEIVRAWRSANPEIVSFWYALEDTVIRAIQRPGITLDCRMLKVRRSGNWLRIRLPSGRCLCYPMPRFDPKKTLVVDGKEVKNPVGGITFMGLNQYTRRYERLQTYSGRLVENVVQATARDVFAECLERVEAAGYPVILHVHDGIIAETPDTEEWSGDRVAELMSVNPTWADGLPIAAEGSETRRYRK
jgi:DNA polymerase